MNLNPDDESYLVKSIKIGEALLNLGAGASFSSENSRGQPVKVGRQLAKQLAERAGLTYLPPARIRLTALTNSSVALAVQQIAADKKKIDIVVGSSTPALTGSACAPYGFQWAFDTHGLAVSTGGALVKTGADTWYFITPNYAFGEETRRRHCLGSCREPSAHLQG